MKGFVKGVNVLDSNPKMYKYVKKKYKMAAEGDNSANWINKVGNFINGNTGKFITNSILSYIGNKSARNRMDNYTKMAEASVDQQINQQKQQAAVAANQLASQYIQQQGDPDNPNALGGDIVFNTIRNMLYNENVQNIEQDAENRKAQIKAYYNSQKPQMDYSGIVQQGLGLVGKYLSSKTPADVTDKSITDTHQKTGNSMIDNTVSGTSNYMPGVYNLSTYVNPGGTYFEIK